MGVCGCANCGKRFEVMWPNLWAYKRGQGTNVKFLCSWKCLRAYDEQRSGDNVEKRIKLTEAQKDEAYQAAISGGNPLRVLAGIGCKNPSSAWSMIKKQLKKESPESYLRLPDKYKPAAERSTGEVEMPEGTVKAPSMLPNAETPEAPKKRTLEHRKTGIDTEIGEFHYYRRNGYLDWSPDGSFQDTVSLKVEEWQALMELFPIVAEELGVEL